MMEMSWYETKSGWMWQHRAGDLVQDSLRACADHATPRRECPECDDGPAAEEGYVVGAWDGDAYPIFCEGELVAKVDYAHDGSMRVIRVEGLSERAD